MSVNKGKVHGFSWNGVSYIRRIRTSCGLVNLSITCGESDIEGVRALSSQMLATGKNWPTDRDKAARIVTCFLSDLGNYSEIYGAITVEDLNLVHINSTFYAGEVAFSSYLLKLERDGNPILDQGQFLQVSTELDIQQPVTLFSF